MSDNRVLKKSRISLGNPINIYSAYSYSPRNTESALRKTDAEKDTSFSQRHGNILMEANREAEEIIACAKEKAALLTDECHIEIERTRNRIYEESREEGFKKGYEEAKERYAELLNEGENIRNRAEEEYYHMMNSLEEDIVKLVLDMFKKVTAKETENSRQYIEGLAKEAVEMCSDRRNIKLKFSEHDFEYINDNAESIYEASMGIENIEIVPDKSLSKGDCIAETQCGYIDTGLKTRTRLIEQAFRELVGHNEPV